MRRRDREITDRAELIDLLLRCHTVRIGIQGEEYPYVVPVSFGVEAIDGEPVVYFHCARSGYKLELLEKNPNVCVESDLFLKTEPTDHGITTRYESVIGFGKAERLSGEDQVRGLRAITEHYGYQAYPIERCRGLEQTVVYKIPLTRITGKRNRTEE